MTLHPLANHLWQSTLCAAVIGVICAALRNNTPRTRYWLWFAASVKFLIPFSLLVTAGTRLEIPAVAHALPAITVEQISTSFSPASMVLTSRPTPSLWPYALLAIWAAGAILVAARWTRQWMILRREFSKGTEIPLEIPIPTRVVRRAIEPGIFGILRPVLLLPEGIRRVLTAEQFDAILTHELCHVRHRDNLFAALHMAVQALFWFHPLVWWIGYQLIEERERACDEAVLAQGNQPETYAQAIVNVCKFYVASPLPCSAGVTGADLKDRIIQIMSERISRRLSAGRLLVLSLAGVAAVALPIGIGILRAQTLPPPPAYTYDVVSIRPADPNFQGSRIGPGPQGGMRAQNNTILQLLTFAYGVPEYQISGVPGWAKTDRYDVSFTPDKAEPAVGPGINREVAEGVFSRHRQRLQAVLRDRLGLVMRAEVKESPIYALVIAKGGHKLVTAADPNRPHMSAREGQITGTGVYIKMLTDTLSRIVGRPINNETGLDGPFDLKLEWAWQGITSPEANPSPGDDVGPSLVTALTEQLGLRLESKKGPVPVFVIEKISKPTEN